ncbi:MAG: TIGR04282 family arsenosugar biosynthesis glycosyltransferase [Acidobacteriota bacterium]
MSARLLLFTKPARPGRVKTRLAATLGVERAAEIHRAFAGDVVDRLRRSGRFELDIAWALDGGEDPPDWPEALGLRWHRQVGEDLGARLYRSLAAHADAGPVAAVGSDHPEMPLDRVEGAFAALERGDADVVLGPALDGGYYLIALAPGAVRRRLFEDIDWSTDRVRLQTLERAAELGLRVTEAEVGHDIDREPDLRALVERLAEGGDDCPRTRRCLEGWGWMAPPAERSGDDDTPGEHRCGS